MNLSACVACVASMTSSSWCGWSVWQDGEIAMTQAVEMKPHTCTLVSTLLCTCVYRRKV